MNHIKLIKPINIYFFLEEERREHQLKVFLNFLSTKGKVAPRFSFVGHEGPLDPQLSLKENILLEEGNFSLGSRKNIRRLIQQTENKALLDFYESIPLLKDRPFSVDDQTRKMTALVKGFLQKSDYLLLDHPEKYLNHTNTQLLVDILEHRAAFLKQTIFLAGPGQELWRPYTTEFVYRGPDRSFACSPAKGVPEGALIKEPEKGHLEFFNVSESEPLLDKKVSGL